MALLAAASSPSISTCRDNVRRGVPATRLACSQPCLSVGASEFVRGSYILTNQGPSRGLRTRKDLLAVAEQSVYEFTVKDIDRKDVSLSKYKGKVLLVVNVASRCGLTTSNYTDLARLYKKLKSEDFEILAFPCNQFGGQEPGTNQQIKEFACSRFKAEYPIFDKVDVNGFNTAPLYKFLKSSKSSGLFGSTFADNIKWNFAKFLVDKNGRVVQRYEPSTSPLAIEKDIRKLLSA
ncbi:hypothetical protein GOP47_0007413 [Adiantum capillus-veneris]|uniref:Glutathione peroxidase n=1 Tax=Adiantum capillus-veneris TaxID=13818 RepID=A0A9D4ZJA0_ADICA|nr:hypothetical protein GOP47_0007413 [Adiantum capillus-veneris]